MVQGLDLSVSGEGFRFGVCLGFIKMLRPAGPIEKIQSHWLEGNGLLMTASVLHEVFRKAFAKWGGCFLYGNLGGCSSCLQALYLQPEHEMDPEDSSGCKAPHRPSLTFVKLHELLS